MVMTLVFVTVLFLPLFRIEFEVFLQLALVVDLSLKRGIPVAWCFQESVESWLRFLPSCRFLFAWFLIVSLRGESGLVEYLKCSMC